MTALNLSGTRMKCLINSILAVNSIQGNNNFLFHFVFKLMFINFANPN
jgi:hypothetical protein